MSIGVDTNWLVQVALIEHVDHRATLSKLRALAEKGETLALAPLVLAEFVHVVTDLRRFAQPLEMTAALDLAEQWASAPEVRMVYPTAESERLAWRWMREHRLGRKRILDTQLAATYHVAGVSRILTANSRDFAIFGCFKVEN